MYSKEQLTIYRLAATHLHGIGPVVLKVLLEHLGSVEALFQEDISSLLMLEGLNKNAKQALSTRAEALHKAEQELLHIQKNKIQVYWYEDPEFPQRLNECPDAPCVLFAKGNVPFNAQKVLAIVGTRALTKQGVHLCADLVHQLAQEQNLLIVSGLAYGADITAHQAAYEAQIPTLAVLAHGLQEIYPKAHQSIAEQFMESGGICSEYHWGMFAEKGNFPKRNRIVAGLSDATLVIESAVNGGSMITANTAFSYGREVLAFPSAVGSTESGTNQLIKTHRASLIEHAQDLKKVLGWDSAPTRRVSLQEIPKIQLEGQEQRLYTLIQKQGKTHIDAICQHLACAQGDVAMDLLNLEFKGLLESMPGNYYEIK